MEDNARLGPVEGCLQHMHAVFNTDQINRKNIVFPAAALMRSYEEHWRAAERQKIDVGMPSHWQHDVHRLLGWCRQLGLYIDSDMVRDLGRIEFPEDEEERQQLSHRVAKHRDSANRTATEPYRKELSQKLGLLECTDVSWSRMEAVFAGRAGIAAELYPEFFIPGLGTVDRDGLVDYRELLGVTTQVLPGVFLEHKRDVLLVAHRFFRRNLSHRNSLNSEFLRSFDDVVRDHGSLQARLKLDPDLLGHPASAKGLIELEYWRGPRFDDDIASIPSGVAEHKADKETRIYGGVDRTQIWWKEPELRKAGNRSVEYRTFEIEELIENPSAGLGDNQFGCRYAHAEFSAQHEAITHFDGAIRAYDGAPYLERIDASIDRAGKRSTYAKVFRLDNELPVSAWKRLLSDYFKGNALVPEYLGALERSEELAAANSDQAKQSADKTPLAAFVSLSSGSIRETGLYSELVHKMGDAYVPYVEIGVGEVAKWAQSTAGHPMIMAVGFRDCILNLSRFGIGPTDELPTQFPNQVSALALALKQDVASGLVRRAAIPIVWENDGLLITLTLAGEARTVATILERLPTLVDPIEMPSAWISALVDLIRKTIPPSASSVIWEGIDRGVLEIERQGTVSIECEMSDELKKELSARGLLQALEKSDPPEANA